MGSVVTKLFDSCFNKEIKILMLGLPHAGKTTILYKLKLGEIVTTYPTIGFNLETVKYKGISFTVWDIFSQDKARVFWHQYYPKTSAIIFVVDSTDTEWIPEVKEELHKAMQHSDLLNAVLVVLANKQDLPGALTEGEVAKELDLASLKQMWRIQATSVIRDQGISEAMDHVVELLDKRK